MKKKEKEIHLGLYLWRDACETGFSGKIKSESDLPLVRTAGVVRKHRGVYEIVHTEYEDTGDVAPGQDKATGLKKAWIKSGILIKIKLKNGFPEKGERVVEVDL